MRKLVPLIFGILGVLLLSVGVAYPLVVLYVDTSAPTIVETSPSPDSTLASVDKILAHVVDDVSGVKTVVVAVYYYRTDVGNWELKGTGGASLTSGDKMNGWWTYTLSTALTSPGDYGVSMRADDYAGNSAQKSFYFKIYTALQGKWYVAGVEITSSSQEIYVNTATVSFKFVKTAGVADQYIACEVWEGTAKLLTMPNTAAGTWEGSYTFTAGKHTITLKAYDGTTTITYSIVGLEIPGAPTPTITITQQQALILAGIACLAIAFYKGVIKPT